MSLVGGLIFDVEQAVEASTVPKYIRSPASTVPESGEQFSANINDIAGKFVVIF